LAGASGCVSGRNHSFPKLPYSIKSSTLLVVQIDITISKEACFYYWLQVVSHWDDTPPEPSSYLYYQENLINRGLTDSQQLSLEAIKDTLSKSVDPRRTLAELYEDSPKSTEALYISKTSASLRSAFEDVWIREYPTLKQQRESIKQMDLDQFTPHLDKIIHFFNSSFDTNKQITIYLLLNPPGHGSGGHAINDTSFMLLHPSRLDDKPNDILTLSTLVHEYIHLIEFESSVSRTLYKQAYENSIKPYNIEIPGYTWKMVFVETMVYCFANRITGGLLRPETFGKSIPTLSEMKGGFNTLVAKNELSSNQLIAWVALNILPQVQTYLSVDRVIDQELTEQIALHYKNLLLTKRQS